MFCSELNIGVSHTSVEQMLCVGMGSTQAYPHIIVSDIVIFL